MERTVRVLCSTKQNPFSYLIRFANFSLWSHEAIIFNDHVIEAVWLDGVRIVPISKALEGVYDYGVLEFDVPEHVTYDQMVEAWSWLFDQHGKKYDRSAIGWQIFGRILSLFGIRRNWQDDSKWFCFELREAFLRRLGIFTTRNDPAIMRATDCWDSPIGRVITRPRTIEYGINQGGV